MEERATICIWFPLRNVIRIGDSKLKSTGFHYILLYCKKLIMIANVSNITEMWAEMINSPDR